MSRAAYQREWRKKNKRRVKGYRRKYRAITPEHTRPSAKKWAKENYIRRKGYNLKRMYGISRETYERMLQEQGGVCAVCCKPESTLRKGKLCELSVDHNHTTGEVRKLLCNKCNIALGMMDECPDRIRQLANYINSFQKAG